MNIEKVDILVVGAGPSGSMAAAIANKSGLNVKIIEKTKFPRFVIGESLLARCMDHFEEAGVLEELKKHNFQVKNGAIFLKGEQRCEFDFSEQFTKGKAWTWQVPRDKFDKIIADQVESMGVAIDYESEVIDIKFNGTESTTIVKDKRGVEKKIEAKFIIDASGYGRVIPKLLDLNYPSTQPNRSTIFTHFKDLNRPNTEDSNRIIAISHKPDVWIWVIPFSNGNTSCGFVGNLDYLEKYKGTPTERLKSLINNEPLLKVRFRNSDMIFEPLMISAYSIAVKQLHGPGYVLTGNSTEFLDPIFSAGVTFATESGILAGKLASKQLKGEKIDWDLEYSVPILNGIEVFRTYIDAWYDGSLHKIFFSDIIDEKVKKQICSVLAGYVWDKKNPFVARHKQSVRNLANLFSE
ncbi:MAG: NAD(P)/FAD-dependent oxidoreductase [Candidatus Marinimicrobia bacterium]|nr:NAD(P)/FAD-dependent oxidoreductase [Candidatus Neomarinimicrobiota bacterium]